MRSPFSSPHRAVFHSFYFGFMVLAGSCHKQVVSHLKRSLAMVTLYQRVESRPAREVRNRDSAGT